MNEVTRRARRSDALYSSSNEGIDRRWLCDRVAYLESQLREVERKLKEAEECQRQSGSS